LVDRRRSGKAENEQSESSRAVTRASWADLLDWKISTDANIPMYQQVSSFLRDKIISGCIPPGSKLPSSRQLLGQLGVSRTTIITAYSQLLADGYIVGHLGSGTYVAKDIVQRFDSNSLPVRPTQLPLPGEPDHSNSVSGLSLRGQRYHAVSRSRILMENVPFNTGMVRVDGRTSAQWRQLAARNLAIDPMQLGYIDPMGNSALRAEIAKYLAVSRGVRCTPEQIMLVSGTQQGIDLAIKVLLDPGAQVWMEDPGYPLTALALKAAGMSLQSVRVDKDGLCVSDGIAAAPHARAAFVTPSHQYPLGVSLSLERRAELLDWAVRNDSWIIEDDYDSEFRYCGPSLPALQALDATGRVIYIGTFSKVLFPGLRCGYIVIPDALLSAFAGARTVSDRHSSVFFGTVLAEFLERGFFVSHIRRMRDEYRRARDILAAHLARNIGHLIDVSAPDQGMHLVVYLRDGISDELVSEAAEREGVVARPISRLYRDVAPRSGLMLGFAGYDEHRIRSAAARLAVVVERLSAQVMRRQGNGVHVKASA